MTVFRSVPLSGISLRTWQASRYYQLVIPTIGLIIGFYVLTRMVQVLGTKGERSLTNAMALITILVTLFGIVDLLTSAVAPTGLPY